MTKIIHSDASTTSGDKRAFQRAYTGGHRELVVNRNADADEYFAQQDAQVAEAQLSPEQQKAKAKERKKQELPDRPIYK